MGHNGPSHSARRSQNLGLAMASLYTSGQTTKKGTNGGIRIMESACPLSSITNQTIATREMAGPCELDDEWT